MMGRTGVESGRSASAAPRWPAVATVAAYAAGFVAFAYALVSLYWALGGRGLISTVGGYAEQFARRGGAAPVLLAWPAAGCSWNDIGYRSRWTAVVSTSAARQRARMPPRHPGAHHTARPQVGRQAVRESAYRTSERYGQAVVPAAILQ